MLNFCRGPERTDLHPKRPTDGLDAAVSAPLLLTDLVWRSGCSSRSRHLPDSSKLPLLRPDHFSQPRPSEDPFDDPVKPPQPQRTVQSDTHRPFDPKTDDTPAPDSSPSPALLPKHGFFRLQKLKMAIYGVFPAFVVSRKPLSCTQSSSSPPTFLFLCSYRLWRPTWRLRTATGSTPTR